MVSRRLCLALGAALLSACTTLPKAPPADPGAPYWSGRIAIQVEGDARQAFSADFELQGQARAGQLTLTSPLGTTLAQMDWTPQRARLQRGTQEAMYDSVETLVLQGTGVALPLQALFDWLDGRAAPAAGWEPDLSQFHEGRITARRTDPLPRVELRIRLSR